MQYTHYLLLFCTVLNVASATVLHTSNRWILNEKNERVKLRCVNWPGHMETHIPEGLQHQSVSKIASWVASAGFNCVRLTYSVDAALDPDQSVSDAFNAAAGEAKVSTEDMKKLYDSAQSKNSWLSSASTQSAFAHVVDALGAEKVLVILDNHVSRASWCCQKGDGNGWWASAQGYDEDNSRYFDTDKWLQSLENMAKFSKDHSNVVGMSLRNELRAVLGQDMNNHAEWYDLMGKGATRIHSTHPDLLIAVGGGSFATDLSFVKNKPFDRSPYSDKIIWEFHSYEWSGPFLTCYDFNLQLGVKAGYLLTQGQEYTGPLWLSEFGWNQDSPSDHEKKYIECITSYMTGNDADWAVWVLAGSYYVNNGKTNTEESYGLLNADWSGWRKEDFLKTVGKMMNVTQGP